MGLWVVAVLDHYYLDLSHGDFCVSSDGRVTTASPRGSPVQRRKSGGGKGGNSGTLRRYHTGQLKYTLGANV